MHLILYGPPGAGKTTVGRLIAARLGREFVDGDAWIEGRWSRPIATYFERGEEPLFRAREAEVYRTLAAGEELVIAPGGGALLNPHIRAALEATGVIVCLTAGLDTLLSRLDGSQARPLLEGDRRARLAALLKERESLYRSFALRTDTDHSTPESVADEVIARFRQMEAARRFELGDGSALMGRGLLARLPELIAAKGLCPPFAVISDSNVAPVHGGAVCRALSAFASAWAAPSPGAPGDEIIQFPAGEGHKTLDTVRQLYAACLARGLERGGTVLALGGGVVSDVAGFAAATFMRGVRWVSLPTTLLAMADASLGGKVGVDLPEGKNLVGAFHPPALVVADFDTLTTLPEIEIRCGLAEVVKAGIIGDPDLFHRLSFFTAESAEITENQGHLSLPIPWNDSALSANPAVIRRLSLEVAIARAAAVKVGIVNADPYERGERAKLNFGHTLGHGIERASGYTLRHGEAISIGMVAEARLAEGLGLCEAGLSEQIRACLERLGLPTHATGLRAEAVRAAVESDKKRAGGRLKFALPKRVGEVVWGVEVGEQLLVAALQDL